MTSTAAPPPATDFHPLEIIPFFRRWPCGFWRDIVYTFIWNTGVAALFWFLALLWAPSADPVRLAWLNFAFAQCIGYTIHVMYVVAYALVPGARQTSRVMRALFHVGIPMVGVVIGVIVGVNLLGGQGMPRWFLSPRGMFVLIGNAVLITGIILVVTIPRERAARAQARLAAAEREAALAQLKALQAQVEPHFLYNTLAHVTSLIDADPRQARAMLDRLIALLRSTAKTSENSATLGAQIEHLRAYLDILAMRMGPRLRWTIDVPASLSQVELPPALLQPLVENAIKHGLEPQVEGGSIDVRARETEGMLELTVSDTGRGFGSTNAPIGGSTQLGLAVLKQRLAALYGGRAALTLAENSPHGVRVTLTLPKGDLR